MVHRVPVGVVVRFHTQNDHGDWDTVHHAFTAANALHQSAAPQPDARAPARRGAGRAAHLPRPLPQRARGPAAAGDDRQPRRAQRTASTCRAWSTKPANEAYGFLHGGRRAELIAALGHALLAEDAEFHWFQTFEAGVRQAHMARGIGGVGALLLGVARFLAAHTPTRRELPTVVRIATRLRRGEALYEDDDDN